MVVIKEVPFTFRTDKYEIRVYRESGVISFHPLSIFAGVVVARDSATFRLDKRQFKNHPKELAMLKEAVRML